MEAPFKGRLIVLGCKPKPTGVKTQLSRPANPIPGWAAEGEEMAGPAAPVESQDFAALISMALGLTLSFLGQVMVRTPFSYLASILSAFTAAGSVKEREKEP